MTTKINKLEKEIVHLKIQQLEQHIYHLKNKNHKQPLFFPNKVYFPPTKSIFEPMAANSQTSQLETQETIPPLSLGATQQSGVDVLDQDERVFNPITEPKTPDFGATPVELAVTMWVATPS